MTTRTTTQPARHPRGADAKRSGSAASARTTGAGRQYRERQDVRTLRRGLIRSQRVVAAIGESADDLATAAAELGSALDRYQAARSRVRKAARDVGIDDTAWTALEGD